MALESPLLRFSLPPPANNTFIVGIDLISVVCRQARCGTLDVRCWMLNAGCCAVRLPQGWLCSVPPAPAIPSWPASNCQYMCWMLEVECLMLDAVCWTLDAACWLLDARCWMLDAGCAILDAGCLRLECLERPRQPLSEQLCANCEPLSLTRGVCRIAYLKSLWVACALTST